MPAAAGGQHGFTLADPLTHPDADADAIAIAFTVPNAVPERLRVQFRCYRQPGQHDHRGTP